jgi:S-adenosylmethionine decarboxylase
MSGTMICERTEEMNFKAIRNKFESENAWGLLTSIDLHGCNPETIRDCEKIKEYVDKLCALIKMKKFGECIVVHFGEDEKVSGFSMAQLIETSMISGHFANLTNAAYIDIFSCKLYDPVIAADFTKKFFSGNDYNIQLAFRK